ncbi:MAG: GT4 family glycosyltransferase PelF [Candidatus Heimdallarchaeota archaeon]
MKKQLSVLLITEGTYPGIVGGVSEWCHRLINGMPKVDFKIISISSSQSLSHDLRIPPNVSELTILSLWDFKAHYYKFSQNSRWRQELREFNLKKLNLVKWGRELLKMSSDGFDSETPLKRMIPKILRFPVPKSDIIHSMNSGLAGLLGLIGKRQHKVPLLITEHGSYYKEWLLSTQLGACVSKERCWGTQLKSIGSPGPILNLIEQMVRYTLGNADLILPVTTAHVSWELCLGAQPGSIMVIPNGVDTLKFQPREKEDQDSIMIGSICRVTPIKDIHTLILAAKWFLDRIPRAEFHLIGPIEDISYYLSCSEVIEDLGLEDRFHFHKATREPEKWYSQFDLFALSSISEGMPLSILEAMATGVPVVATDVGGNREVTRGLGMLVPARQPVAFAKALQRSLHLNRRRKHKKSIQTRRMVKQRFSETQLIRSYAKIYAKLLKRQ